jgi:type II secretory ATPase GspE/PulE/Tfp pilus assembly ATPase PilB-like protein
MLDQNWLRRQRLHYDGDKRCLYADTPPGEQLLGEIAMLLGFTPSTEIIPSTELEALLTTDESNSGSNAALFHLHSETPSATDNDVNRAAAGDTIGYVDALISRAIHGGASDIHIDARANQIQVRFRHHGQLKVIDTYAPARHRSVMARLKIMSGLDIAETRRPLDGNIRVSDGHRQVDIRLATMAGRFGEKAVLRILDKSRLKLDFAALGFSAEAEKMIRTTIAVPHGLILCTGPTGSGKTTTLYAILAALNRPEVNILTIEDPIEYELAGINQSQVHTAIGLTFATALRSFLRQDPDIIMVGEIRDEETTAIALRAAMTGHLVLSTLHTSTPQAAARRLEDLGASPFLVRDTLRLTIGQTLAPVFEGEKLVGRKLQTTIV